jgi:hypothetical protein
MIYNIKEFQKIDFIAFNEVVHNGSEFELSFPLESVGFAQSHIDIIRDYLEVSYCSEKISPFIKVIKSELVTSDKYYKNFEITCIALDIPNLFNELKYFSNIFGDEDSDLDDIDKISFMDEVSDYETTLSKKTFVFPELINNYWANLVNGAYWEIASEFYESEEMFFTKTYRKYPEQRYGFWKNPQSADFFEPLYFSTENWIVPPNTNLINALKLYSGLENNLILENADKIEMKGNLILINNYTAIHFIQWQQLLNSINCAERTLKKIYVKTDSGCNSISKSDDAQLMLFDANRIVNRKTRRQYNKSSTKIDENKLKFQLSEFGDLITVEYDNFIHVFFSFDQLNFEELKELNAYLNPLYSKVQNIIDKSISEKCNWLDLNEDTFEELCYDILFCHPSFDSTTIQKMGKSKSRDGGRDIVIKKKKTPTTDRELFVFQCKFYSESKSLSASKVSNAGNVIMQYGAKGYGIFTSTVIDSTLYDMLDGFSRNLNIDTSLCWSKYELERYINGHQLIKNKYFKNSKV